MTDEKNQGRWQYLIGDFVRVFNTSDNALLFGKLISTNYEQSKFMPYTLSRSTTLTDNIELLTEGKPCSVKEDIIGRMEPVPEEYVRNILEDLKKSNASKSLKRESEELSTKLQILKLKGKIKPLEEIK